jgi:hypothetical protein
MNSVSHEVWSELSSGSTELYNDKDFYDQANVIQNS